MSRLAQSGSPEEEVTVATRPSWRQAHAVFVATLLVWAALYHSSLQSMVRAWWGTGTYHYAFLIFPIVGWLIWIQRRATATRPLDSSVWGIAGLAMVSLLWLLGSLASVNVVQHFSIVAMLPCLVLACYGRPVARALMFPLCYLFFAVPWGNFLVGPLRTVTARISVRLLQLSGATVFLNGHLIEVPVGSFEVADACSGIKFFVATTALGTLFAYLFYRSWRRRLIFVGATLIIPIIANGLRVYFTILIGQTFGMHYATGTDHMIFGWQFFGTVLLLLFLTGWYWRQDPVSSAPVASVGSRPLPLSRHALIIFLMAISLLIGPVVAKITAPAPVSMVAARHWPSQTLAVDGQPAEPVAAGTGLGTGFANADSYLKAVYQDQSAPISVYVAQYIGIPQHGHEVLDFSNAIYGKHWRVSSQRNLTIHGRPIVQMDLESGGQRWLVWYWYDVNGHLTIHPAIVKLLQLWRRLDGQTSYAAFVRLATPMNGINKSVAEKVLRTFYGQSAARIRGLLRG